MKPTFDILFRPAHNVWVAIEIIERTPFYFEPQWGGRRDFRNLVEAPARALANSLKQRIRICERLGEVISEIDANLNDYPYFETAADTVSYLRYQGHRVTGITVAYILGRFDNNDNLKAELVSAVS